MRQRIHERVDQRPLRRRQLDVLAAARIDRERLAAEHRRHLVGIQARGVHHHPRADRFAFGPQRHPASLAVCADESRARQEDRTGVAGTTQQRLHQFLGVDDAASPETTALPRALTAGSRASMNARSTSSSPRRRSLRRELSACRAAEARPRRARRSACRTCDAARRSGCRTRRAAAAPSTHKLAFSVTGGIVDAGVDDAAVVRARVLSRARMPLQHAHALPALGDRERCGQSGDAGSDDGDVDPLHGDASALGWRRVGVSRANQARRRAGDDGAVGDVACDDGAWRRSSRPIRSSRRTG